MEKKKILKILMIIGLIIIIIDQISKFLVITLVKNEVVIISNEILTITKVENEGFAFGLNKQNILNISLSIVIIIVLIRYLISQRERNSKKIVIYLGLIIAGGISNIIDRIIRGAVFDFIKIGQFPVFNVADICIVVGWILFVLYFLKDTAIDFKAEAQK